MQLLRIVNNATPIEVMVLKLLLLGENGKASFDTRRMNESSSLDDALKQLNHKLGTEDNIFGAYDHPLHETKEDLLYR